MKTFKMFFYVKTSQNFSKVSGNTLAYQNKSSTSWQNVQFSSFGSFGKKQEINKQLKSEHDFYRFSSKKKVR